MPSRPPSPSSPRTPSRRGTSLTEKKRHSRYGCEVPFVPAEGGSSFTRFKQLSTRRSSPTKRSPRGRSRTVSSPSLTGSASQSQVAPVKAEIDPLIPMTSSLNPPQSGNGQGSHALSKYALTPHWTIVDEAEDHPCRRKSSGFFQPIKHLSGKLELI